MIEIQQNYKSQKAIFDTTAGTETGLSKILDRYTFLSMLNGVDPRENRIVIVLHGAPLVT